MAIRQGECPKCGAELLYNDKAHDDGEERYFRVECPQCKFTGSEYYKLVFIGYAPELLVFIGYADDNSVWGQTDKFLSA